MINFLRKINLVKDLNFKLNISKIEFTKKFRENVDESNLGYEPFEVFQSSTNQYKGNIYNNNFQLEKRRKFFDTNYSFAKVTGAVIEESEELDITVEIYGLRKRILIFFGIMVVFYLISITASFFIDDNIPFFVLPFFLVHMCLMLGIPYFVIRRGVSRMAYDLERDFHYWVTRN